MPNFPAAQLLVPATPESLADDFQIVTSSVINGFPHFIDLSKSFRLKVTLATGLLQTWLDADPNAIVASSVAETAPRAASLTQEVGAMTRPSIRLAVLQSGSFLSAEPFSLGNSRVTPDAGDTKQGVSIEIVLQAWSIAAGSVRGPGDFGSFIQFGWRQVNLGINDFGPPIVNPFLWHRLLPTLKIQSDLGLLKVRRLTRFNVRRKALNVIS